MSERVRIFRVETGGATYWIRGISGTPFEMMRAIEDAEGVAFEREEWGQIEPDDIREIAEAEAREATCVGDGEPDTDMWVAALACRSDVEVIACSEWP